MQSLRKIFTLGWLKDLNFITRPNTKPSMKGFLGVFATIFIGIIILMNLPAITSKATFAVTHSEEKNNEILTEQYRALYGYEKHPEQVYLPISIARAATEEDKIIIKKIGVDAPILQVASYGDAAILNTLKNGVVLYPGTSLPGQSGSTVIIGHSSSNPPWTKYSAIFSLLNKLELGDVVVVNFRGYEYTYIVSGKEKGSVESLVNKGIAGDLVLSSCWPVGSDQGRIVVTAKLQH